MHSILPMLLIEFLISLELVIEKLFISEGKLSINSFNFFRLRRDTIRIYIIASNRIISFFGYFAIKIT
jgi:hypothetical protein